jgi:hypothetical protein
LEAGNGVSMPIELVTWGTVASSRLVFLSRPRRQRFD